MSSPTVPVPAVALLATDRVRACAPPLGRYRRGGHRTTRASVGAIAAIGAIAAEHRAPYIRRHEGAAGAPGGSVGPGSRSRGPVETSAEVPGGSASVGSGSVGLPVDGGLVEPWGTGLDAGDRPGVLPAVPDVDPSRGAPPPVAPAGGGAAQGGPRDVTGREAAVVAGGLVDRFGLLDQQPDDDLDDDLSAYPVLAELPALGSLLATLRQVDRLVAACVTTIAQLHRHGAAQAVTGVGLEGWMSMVGRRTGADIRMLLTTARLFARVPSLELAFRAGELSWSQVRSIVLAAERLPRQLDDQIDAAVAEGVNGTGGAQPDDVTRVIRWTLTCLDPRQVDDDQQQAQVEEYLAMQPNLDGTGGRFHGVASGVNWATLDAVLNPPLPATTGALRDGFAGDRTDLREDDGRPGAAIRRAGKARLERLVDLLDPYLEGGGGVPVAVADGADSGEGERGAGVASGPAGSADGSADARDGDGAGGRAGSGPSGARRRRGRSRPQLILRTELASLLDRDQTPAKLLTTLLGGQVTVTAQTARRMLEERGADLATVILDETGSVVGVGRRRRIAPDWLRTATLALHDTCAAPTCDTAARVCDIDHATPFHPARPGGPAGRTDIDQLAPVCRRDNTAKEPDGWTATQQPDGTRRWTHRRSGITTRTLPATWRPPPNTS